MIYQKIGNLIYSNFFMLLFLFKVWAQGPNTSYYYNPATELAWAECYMYQQGGSRQKIPFLPVINYVFRAPSGTKKYSKDIDINGPYCIYRERYFERK